MILSWFRKLAASKAPSPARNLSAISLRERYSPFLKLVSNQGEGSIALEVRDKVAIVSISNLSRRNAVCGTMMNDFARIVDELVPADGSEGVHGKLVGVVLKGCGTECFSSGADLNLIKTIVNTPAMGVQMSNLMTDACNRLRQSALISVAVLNGPALGGGSELSTVCDFRIIPNSDKHYIQFVHAKIGASPGWGGARRLTNIVGRRHAIAVCASSVPVKVDRAVQIGLVDQVIDLPAAGVDSEEYYANAGIEFLRPYWSQKYPGSVRAIKAAIGTVEDESAVDSKACEVRVFEGRWCGPDNLAALNKK